MKLYNWQIAPNCRRVRMFILEKGMDPPEIEEVGDQSRLSDIRLSDNYFKIWPHALVPMLETDDGFRIGEAMAICRFLEDEHPQPVERRTEGGRSSRGGASLAECVWTSKLRRAESLPMTRSSCFRRFTPRIARGAVELRLSERHEPEFRDVGLAERDEAGGFEPCY
jgi:glutathione S-transferase